ncbi:Putative cytochrome P450 hydroxylase [hydrothermal vent metagenome]|uniref:Cytochrome P450 hydroxylase n=1 Tax=hydrothermal vent metagenome TaxID=652676 RepID=A0A3B0W0V8_9ZZZZ
MQENSKGWAASAGCPVDHHHLRAQRTAPEVEPTDRPIEQGADGVWHVRGYEEAQAILRSDVVRQAGFQAEMLEKLPSYMNPPILFLEGKPHQEQRRQTARFFTPRTTDSQYRQMMRDFADEVVADFVRRGRADLSEMSMKMAVRVASQVVGLTNSKNLGMNGRIERFLQQGSSDFGWTLRQIKSFIRIQFDLLRFFLLDVRPAIKVRQAEPQEDVISHLLASGYGNTEIMTECITYGAAGMVTTREFISVALWHCLENREWHQLMLTADQNTRYTFLHELLRLKPVVGHLYRKTTAALTLQSEGKAITIPAGSMIDLHVYAVNGDESIVGERPLQLCPARKMKPRKPKVPQFVMSFGDGPHRCPGTYIAIQESDIFLRRLLKLENLRIEQQPTVTYNQTVKGYELRNFIIALD